MEKILQLFNLEKLYLLLLDLVCGFQCQVELLQILLGHYVYVKHGILFCEHHHHALTLEGGGISIASGGHLRQILVAVNNDGKINLRELAKQHNMFCPSISDTTLGQDHFQKGAAILISNPTVTGQLYALNEIKKLREFCDKNNLKLIADTAWLPYGLACMSEDTRNNYLRELPKLTDALTFSLPKIGCGDNAMIFFPLRDEHFADTIRKCGKPLGNIMFNCSSVSKRWETIWTKPDYNSLLWRDLSRYNKEAAELREFFEENGFLLVPNSYSNTIFISLPQAQAYKASSAGVATKWPMMPAENEGYCTMRIMTGPWLDNAKREAIKKIFKESAL